MQSFEFLCTLVSCQSCLQTELYVFMFHVIMLIHLIEEIEAEKQRYKLLGI